MRNQAGFTLLEAIIVIAIAGILSAIAIPSYLEQRPKYNLDSAADDVQMALNAARVEAIKSNNTVTVNFDPPHESYEVLRNGTSLHSDRMPSGVDLKTVYEVGSTTVHNSIAFDSRGFPDQGVEITLVNTKNQSRIILLSLTGSTRVD